jgi:hypothetical protein
MGEAVTVCWLPFCDNQKRLNEGFVKLNDSLVADPQNIEYSVRHF